MTEINNLSELQDFVDNFECKVGKFATLDRDVGDIYLTFWDNKPLFFREYDSWDQDYYEIGGSIDHWVSNLININFDVDWSECIFEVD